MLKRFEARDPMLARAGFVFLSGFFPLLVLLMTVHGLINGENAWLKPAKFAISIGVYLLTMAWLTGELPRRRVLSTLLALTIAGSMLLEQGLITMQAARGTASHYNDATSFDAIVFSLMGTGIGANTTAVAVVLLLFCLQPDGQRPGYLWGIRAGLVLFLLGSLEGYAMIQNGAHTVGAPDGGPGIPLLRWSTTAGDLRIAHFVGIHAIQVLPLVGHVLDRSAASIVVRRMSVLAAALAYAALGALSYQQAVLGRSGFLVTQS